MSASPRESPAPTTRRFIKRPDDKVKEEKIAAIRAQIKEKDAAISKLTSQLNATKTDSAVLDERKGLQNQLSELVKQQSSTKQQRQALQNQIKNIDTGLKKKITDLNAQNSKNSYKSVEEIDKKIQQLDSLIDSGSLKIVDERKTIKEMSALRKLKKDFSQIEQQQKSIDDDKAKIAELKKQLNSIQNKEVQAKFEEISGKLDKINLGNKSINDKRNEIFNKRVAIYKEKDELYDSLKKIKAEADAEYAKFKKAMAEEKLRRSQEEKLYQLSQEKEELLKDAEAKLNSAKVPAFTEEINSIYNLLQHFDPQFERPQTSILPSAASSTNNKTSRRTIEMPADAQIIKKEPLNTFAGSKSKKGKKNGAGASAKSTKFSIEPTIIVSLSELGVALPTSQDDVETTKTQLLEKLESFKSKQDEQTAINIKKAEENKAKVDKQIEKLTNDILNAEKKEETPVDGEETA